MIKSQPDEIKLLFEYPWFHKLVETCKEYNLDWLRMSAIALELSGGDPRFRAIDYEFLYSKLGPDNPSYLGYFDEDLNPSVEVIDRATRWGLFLIHGEAALKLGFNGKLINLIDIGLNTKLACKIMSELLTKLDSQAAEKYFGVDSTNIDARVSALQEQIQLLTSIASEKQ